jgi:hypothetical protein
MVVNFSKQNFRENQGDITNRIELGREVVFKGDDITRVFFFSEW